MRKSVAWLLLPALSLLLSACDPAPTAVVRFAQPFPVGATDVAALPARAQGRYGAATDTSRQLAVGPGALVWRRTESWPVRRSAFDSLRQTNQLFRAGTRYRAEAVGADSVRLRWYACDTLFNLRRPAGGHLRRYRGRYYLSTLVPEDSLQWEVRRLTLAKGYFVWESCNPDSLRLRALTPATVRLRRQAGRLFFTLDPAPGPATRQVHDYAGLWLPE